MTNVYLFVFTAAIFFLMTSVKAKALLFLNKLKMLLGLQKGVMVIGITLGMTFFYSISLANEVKQE